MKAISKYYSYDDSYFSGRIPADAQYLPDPEHDLPVFIKENLIPPAVCDEMVARFRAMGTCGSSPVDFGNRMSEQYDLTGENKAAYEHAFSAAKTEIEQYFCAEILDSAGAHGLGYYPGGRYGVHSDNCVPVMDETGELIRFELEDPGRQISTV